MYADFNTWDSFAKSLFKYSAGKSLPVVVAAGGWLVAELLEIIEMLILD